MLIFRLNSLYVYDKKEDDCPRQFWLLSTMKELIQLDSDEQEYLLELAFDAEIVIFKFNEQESLGSWRSMIEKAKDFNASNYYTGETVTEIKEVILAHDTSTVLIFNMDKKSQIIKQGILLIENITDVIMKDLKPECTLVSLFDLSHIFCSLSLVTIKNLHRQKVSSVPKLCPFLHGGSNG